MQWYEIGYRPIHSSIQFHIMSRMQRIAFCFLALLVWDCVDDLFALVIHSSDQNLLLLSTDDDEKVFPLTLVERAAFLSAVRSQRLIPTALDSLHGPANLADGDRLYLLKSLQL